MFPFCLYLRHYIFPEKTRPNKLKTLSMYAIDIKTCHEIYGNLLAKYAVYEDRQICAGGEKGKDSCEDDSGAGLISKVKDGNESGRYKLVGYVSWGLINCATEGYPGVYVKVAFFLEWILDNLREFIL